MGFKSQTARFVAESMNVTEAISVRTSSESFNSDAAVWPDIICHVYYVKFLQEMQNQPSGKVPYMYRL